MQLINKLFTLVLTIGIFISLAGSVLANNPPVNPYSFNAVPGSKLGTVKITWYDDGDADKYNLVYGTDPNNYTFGVVDMGHSKKRSNEFTVEYLTPGQTYYFKLYGGNTEVGPIKVKAASTASLASKSTYYSVSKNYEMPYLFALNYGDGTGVVNITWFDNDTADKYDIVYGLSPSNYSYGFQNMPNNDNLSNTFAVRGLTSGKTYYFALVAERNGVVVSWSQPLSILAK